MAANISDGEALHTPVLILPDMGKFMNPADYVMERICFIGEDDNIVEGYGICHPVAKGIHLQT